MVKVFCDGIELQGAEVSAGDLAVPWLLELKYSSNRFSRQQGSMRVNYQGWGAFLDKHGWGAHEPLILLIAAAGRSPTRLQVWATDIPPTGQFSIQSLVLPTMP